MGNFKDFFPNVEDASFTVGDAPGTANQIYGWAQANDTTKIPASKLPDTAFGDLIVFTIDGATLAGFVTAWNAGTATNISPAPAMVVLHGGDILEVIDSTGGTNVVTTYLYAGADNEFGTSGTDLEATDFTQISSSAFLLADGTNTTASGSKVNLNADLDGITSINQETSGTASAIQIGTSPMDGPGGTANTVGVYGTTTVIGGTTEVQIDATILDVNAGTGGASITSTNTSSDAIFISASGTGGGVDIDAAGAVSVDSGTGALTLTSGSNQNLVISATGTGELRASGTGIVAGTDAVPNILGIGTDGRLQTSNVSSSPSVNIYSEDTGIVKANQKSGDLFILGVPSLAGEAGTLPTMVSPADIVVTLPEVEDADKGLTYRFSNQSRTNAFTSWTIARGGTPKANIEGQASDLILDDNTASFDLVYSGNATYGWVIVGVN